MEPMTPAVTRIPLARSLPRLLALPAVLVVVAAGLAGIAILVLPLGGVAWSASLAAAVLLGFASIALAVRLVTTRIDVEHATVRLHWLGGERRYELAAGPVTRVRLGGENASRLRARSRWLGWGLGRARLRDEEWIEVVRLASTPTVILLPTDRGRLAIAAASEEQLIDALSRAARTRQRLEEASPAAPAPAEATSAPESEAVEAPPEPEPHALTGIERALLEERLAREREEAQAQAPAPATSLETDPQVDAVADTPAATAPPETTDDVTERAPGRRRRWPFGRVTAVLFARPGPSAAFIFVPLIGAGIVWGAAAALGDLPPAGSDLGRLTSLGLVLAGPATSVGAVMALAWWPRLVGVVVTSGLAASVFIGRALLGA